jgi:hypothetical protein
MAVMEESKCLVPKEDTTNVLRVTRVPGWKQKNMHL